MLNPKEVMDDLRSVGFDGCTQKEVQHLTLLLNKRLEKFLQPRISEAWLREIVQDEIKKAGTND